MTIRAISHSPTVKTIYIKCGNILKAIYSNFVDDAVIAACATNIPATSHMFLIFSIVKGKS
ncbi:hypothetical protein [Dissulfurispira thermophila]|uniref:Uncharacterized protein n=1 Tax=hot springs metagenome TaxID=433727 RepID=A0A5J4L5C3_9ZZZZ|nr:hypothetical protein [Dissulfurispira thermophila]